MPSLRKEGYTIIFIVSLNNYSSSPQTSMKSVPHI